MSQFQRFHLFSLILLGLTAGQNGVAGSPQAGEMQSFVELKDRFWSKKALNLSKISLGAEARSFRPSRSAVKTYRLIYWTHDPQKNLVKASGLVQLPVDALSESLPLVSYQHATLIGRKNGPSVNLFDAESQATALFFSSMNYVVCLADYLGLGVSSGPQYYLQANSQSEVVYDFIRATQEFVNSQAYRLNGSLVITGYSQGAHTSMALQRLIESQPIAGLNLRANAPLSGPYNLSSIGLEKIGENGRSKMMLMFMAMTLLSMKQSYDYMPPLNQILQEPYATRLPELMNQGKDYSEIARALPGDLSKLFVPAALASLRAGDPSNPLIRALKENDVDTSWLPQNPLLLVHARSDEVNALSGVEKVYEQFKDLQAPVQIKILENLKLDHVSAFFPALIEAARFFESHRN